MQPNIPWEDNYIGTWVGAPSRVLTIRKIGDRKYLVSLTVDGKPVLRPWMNGEPTTNMPAEYTFDGLDGSDFCVDLWPPKTRLSIHLGYEPSYELDPEQREALTFAFGGNVNMLEKSREYCNLIGGLQYFVRSNTD